MAAMMVKALVLRVSNQGFNFTMHSPKHVTLQVSEVPVAA